LVDAYGLALGELDLLNRSDPLCETVAQYIIEAAQTGEKDPARLCALAIRRIANDEKRPN
jgi:hypothetical protein